MRRISLALVLAALALGGAGCFAFEEIDKGQEIMDQHFSGRREAGEKSAEKEASPPPEDASPGLLARARSWWSGEEEPGEAPPAPSGPPPHPEDRPGRCVIDGSMQFMRKFDCQLRGGRYVPSQDPASR